MESTETYDPSNSRYKCGCFGGCHVITGTKIICSLLLAWYLFVVLYRIILFPHPTIFIIGIILVSIALFVFVSTLYGLKVERPNWLLPLLIVLVLTISLIVIQNLYALYIILTDNRINIWPIESLINENQTKPWPFESGNQSFVILMLYILIKLIVFTAITVWMFSIVYRCYQYLCTKNKDVRLPSHQQYF